MKNKIIKIALLFSLVLGGCQKVQYLPHPIKPKCGIVERKTVFGDKYLLFINGAGLPYSKEVWERAEVGVELCNVK